jgi:hypothetical protein
LVEGAVDGLFVKGGVVFVLSWLAERHEELFEGGSVDVKAVQQFQVELAKWLVNGGVGQFEWLHSLLVGGSGVVCTVFWGAAFDMESSNLVDEAGGEELNSVEAVLKFSNPLALGEE